MCIRRSLKLAVWIWNYDHFPRGNLVRFVEGNVNRQAYVYDDKWKSFSYFVNFKGFYYENFEDLLPLENIWTSLKELSKRKFDKDQELQLNDTKIKYLLIWNVSFGTDVNPCQLLNIFVWVFNLSINALKIHNIKLIQGLYIWSTNLELG